MKLSGQFLHRLPLLILPALLSSCATLNFSREKIAFEETALPGLSAITQVELERNGLSADKPLLLRFSKPEGGKIGYRENSVIYAQIDGDSGLRADFARIISQNFKDAAEGGWMVENVSHNMETPSESLALKFHMTTRGEITRIISGKGTGADGKLEVLEWTRTPIFPADPVRPGDKWPYNEKMKVKITSFLLDKNSGNPEDLDAVSTFQGYAQLRGSACAVITTRAMQSKKETFSTLLKNLSLGITCHVKETMYFDIMRGAILAKIADVHMFTVSDDGSFADESISRTIMTIED